ncbi:MAG TPA: hypothetical protein VH573_22715 [Mycobacteriales bacterium]|jgi:hypothetical protein
MTQSTQPRRRRVGLRLAALGAALVAAAATATTLALAGPADALPASQSSCTAGTLALSPSVGFFPLTPARTVSVPNATTVKASLTADVGVDAGAEVRLAWSVNNSALVEGAFGPANFANHAEFFETRSTFALIPVAGGTVSIQPWVRVSSSNGRPATLLQRCVAIEASTF